MLGVAEKSAAAMAEEPLVAAAAEELTAGW